MLVKRRILKSVRAVAGFAVVAAFLAGFNLFGNTVQAQSANTLKVTPVRTDIEILPGETKSVPVTISNITGADILVKAIANDFVAGDERGTPALILDEDAFAPTHSLKRFMTPIPDLTIPANEGVTVNVVISIPADAQAGGYFGAIRFAPTDPANGGQVNLSASVASLILLNVPGDAVQKLVLTDFDIQQAGKTGTDFRTSNDLQVSARFENKGSVQLGPFGKVSVKQGDKLIYESDFNIENPREVVLPDSARRWDIPLKEIGEFGHYTVSATFTYGTTNQTIEVSKSFWVIPQYMIIIAIIVAVLLIGGIALAIFLIIRRNKTRRRAPKASNNGMRRIR